MENYQQLNDTITNLENESKKLKTISDTLTEITSLKNSIEKSNHNSSKLISQLSDISDKLQSQLTGYNKSVSEMEKSVNKLQIENQALFHELEKHITSKLEKHQSDIIVELRNSTKSIESSVELVISKNIYELQKKIDEKLIILNHKQGKLFKVYVIFSIIILLALILAKVISF